MSLFERPDQIHARDQATLDETNLLGSDQSTRASRRGERLSILLGESLHECLAIRIEEIFAALFPCRPHFWRCDIPVWPARLENYTRKARSRGRSLLEQCQIA